MPLLEAVAPSSFFFLASLLLDTFKSNFQLITTNALSTFVPWGGGLDLITFVLFPNKNP